MSPTRLGVDFGTSNTVGVLRRGDGPPAPLLFDATPLLASGTFAAPGPDLLTGADAVRAAAGHPAGYEPHPKRHIDEATIWLGEQEIPMVDLIAAVLARVDAEARRVAGHAASTVTLTHPAAWGAVRMGVLGEAARRVGWSNVTFVSEPVAAAAYFAEVLNREIRPGRCLVVYDLGAGTFDVSVVRRATGGLEVAAADGLTDVGGIEIDCAVIDHVRSLTANATDAWGRMDWPQTPADVRAHRELWEDARACKEQLSRHASTSLHVPLVDVDRILTREELEKLARPLLERTLQLTLATMRKAKVTREATAGVFLVGGASRIPLAATLLHRGLGIVPTVIDQPELVVAEGSLCVQPRPVTPSPAIAAGPPPTPTPVLPPPPTPTPVLPPPPTPAPVPPPAPVGPPSPVPAAPPPDQRPPAPAGRPLTPRPARHDAPPVPRRGAETDLEDTNWPPAPPGWHALPPARAADQGGPPAKRSRRRRWLVPVLVGLVLLPLLIAIPAAIAIFRPEAGGINGVAFDPDGTTLAAGGEDGTVQLWDVDTLRGVDEGGRAGKSMTGHTEPVMGVAFRPDGKILASAGADGTVRLWDVPGRKQIGDALTGHRGAVTSVAFDPDGRFLASAGADHTVRLWNVTTMQPFGEPLAGHSAAVSSIAFAPDGKILASASADHTLRLWDVAGGRQVGEPITGHTEAVNGVAFRPEGTMFASASADRTVRLWDVANGRQVGEPITGHTEAVNSVAFRPDGRTLASASADHTVRLWDIADGNQVGEALTGTEPVVTVAFSKDGNTLASGGGENEVRLWNTTDGG